MYHFQVIAYTQTGESIGIVGSTPEMGLWDITRCIRLRTSSDRYPVWWTDRPIEMQSSAESLDRQQVEYKYVLLDAQGSGQWEALGPNRWVPIDPQEQPDPIGVDDGVFGYLQPYPFGHRENSTVESSLTTASPGLKILVIGSSVALGQKAWLLEGWAARLGQAIGEKYGHKLINVSEPGANVSRTIARFGSVVTAEQPDMVIIALSLGNEGLAVCDPPHRRAVQRRFETGLQQLVSMTRAIGARPILGGVYPHGDYTAEHYEIVQDTHRRMLTWDVPILDWLSAVDHGRGRWREGISFDPAHPNTIGHRLMYEAIDLRLFDLDREELAKERHCFWQPDEIPIYRDNSDFYVCACLKEKRLRIHNPTPNNYTIAPYWQELQTVLQSKAKLIPGIYISKTIQSGMKPFLVVGEEHTIASKLDIPAGTEIEYIAAFNLFTPNNSQVLFYDGQLGILRQHDRQLLILNESDHEYNVHPMWKEVRSILKAMPEGVYADPIEPDLPFRTMIIGHNGLESRVKIPPQSSVIFRYQCQLSEIERVGIVPLGDRCAARMLLYQMGYDGPAFPFDLTRTTNIADIADIIATGFEDMWNPSYLDYDAWAHRIYHRKWTGLSFGHEIEDDEDPINHIAPIFERMRDRYSARSERFWYTLEHSDRLLFVRTGVTDRGSTIHLLNTLSQKCQDKPFHLLLLSPQSSEEFANIPNLTHYNVEFNPDRMYADLGHWLHCTEVMRRLLESLGVSTKNLFWCPPNPPQA